MIGLEDIRVVNKYIILDIFEEYYKKVLYIIFFEVIVDIVYELKLLINEGEVVFGVEYLLG